MRAAVGASHEEGGRHLSGAERLVPEAAVDETVLQLLQRARSRGISPDFVRVTVERLAPEAVERIPCLPVTTLSPADAGHAIELASRILAETGISETAVRTAFARLSEGWHGNGPLRGAALVDAASGGRLDPDFGRGVRVSRIDYSPDAVEQLESRLHANKLGHFRIREALAIASKVLWAGVQAELCWSDDPDYTTGYMATPERGYLRLTGFKPPGAVGGRVFFVSSALSSAAVNELIQRLERSAVLIDLPVLVHPPVSGSEFF